jgi:hypothetical protein
VRPIAQCSGFAAGSGDPIAKEAPGCRGFKVGKMKHPRGNLRQPDNIQKRESRNKKALRGVAVEDRERAEAVAVKLFQLDQDQRGRLLIRERNHEQ